MCSRGGISMMEEREGTLSPAPSPPVQGAPAGVEGNAGVGATPVSGLLEGPGNQPVEQTGYEIFHSWAFKKDEKKKLEVEATFGEEGCIKCGATPDQVGGLWDVASALLCAECYDRKIQQFTVHTAKGFFLHYSKAVSPPVLQHSGLELEATAKVIWCSLASGQNLHPGIRFYKNGIYASVYTKMWQFPNGERISTAHLVDGRFLAIAPKIPVNLRSQQTSPPSAPHDRTLKIMRLDDMVTIIDYKEEFFPVG
ncbi:uncharacterized protein LOC115375635 [Myripristis murdjan]|uniref:uncharacterized protein LOC115375635 n=1 Tax=Myripristis murdjan TaxID=586833 RepID=UPI001176416B|nr:uncharacterized protein LOC115375635 [Myripristis murdjan]